MYTNAYCVRELTPLLKNSDISDHAISIFIRKAESIINPLIGKRYSVPIQRVNNATGLINVVSGSEIIEGINTLFTLEVFPGEMIRVNSTGEALRVLTVDSDTSLTVEFGEVTDENNITSYPGKPLKSFSNGAFIIVPDELVTATEYETARLVLLPKLSERAFKDTGADNFFLDEYNIIAKPIIENMRSGNYYDASLVPQSINQNNNRLVYINTSNSNRDRISKNNDIYTSRSWL